MASGPTSPPGAPLPPRSLPDAIARALGIDRAIAYTIAQRSWSLLAAPVTLALIANFLSAEEQGYYYTFASVLGLQSLFELGLSFVLLQFTSHEMASLEWAADGTLAGDPLAKARVASLLRVVLFWYGVVAVLIVVAVLPAGMLFFAKSQHGAAASVHWRLPWVWVVGVSALTLFFGPIFSIIEGCGLVAEVARHRTVQGVLGSLALWLGLSSRWGLYAAPLLSTVVLACGVVWLARWKGRFLRDLLRTRHPDVRVDWWKDVWPFQWRIAVSTLSSYFIFQLFNPLLFAFHGAAAAGKMGMSLTIMTAIAGTAMSWVSTKSAPFGSLIARREFARLDAMFFPSVRQSVIAIVFAGACYWVGALWLRHLGVAFARRILEPIPLALLIATAVINHVVTSEAIYLRAHKREPFLGITIASAAMIGLSSYVLGRPYAATGMMAANFVVALVVGLGGGTWIFVTKRRAWHE